MDVVAADQGLVQLEAGSGGGDRGPTVEHAEGPVDRPLGQAQGQPAQVLGGPDQVRARGRRAQIRRQAEGDLPQARVQLEDLQVGVIGGVAGLVRAGALSLLVLQPGGPPGGGPPGVGQAM